MAEWYDAPVGTRVATEATAAPAPLADDEDLVAVVYPNGSAGTVRRADLQDAIISHGARLEDEGATEARATAKRAEGHQLQTGLESFASTATFGGTDLLAGALSPEYAQEMRDRRENNMAGTIVGGVAGAFTGAGSVASAAGRGAERAVAGRVGTGMGGRVAGAGVRTGVEGGVFGAGMGVSEVGLSKDPVSWESAAATIGSNVLGGAAIGAGIGVGGKLLEEGATAARGMAQRQVESLRAPAETTVDRSAFPEIAAMDKRAARDAITAERETVRASRAAELVEGKAAREAEVASLEEARGAAARELFDEARAYKDYVRPKFIETSDRELATQLKQSKRSIMRGLDNPKGFVEARGSRSVVDGLQKQESALGRVLDDADDVLANAGAERQALLDGLPKRSEVASGPAEIPKGWKDVSGPFASKHQPERGVPSLKDIYAGPGEGKLYVIKRSELDAAGGAHNVHPQKYSSPAVWESDLKKYEKFGRGLDEGAFARPGNELPPINMWMSPDGKLQVEDGVHRLMGIYGSGADHAMLVRIRPRPESWPFQDDMFSWKLGWIGEKPAWATQAAEAAAPPPGLYLTPEQSKIYASWSGTAPPKGQPSLTVTAEELDEFKAAIERGDVHPPGVKRVMDAQEMLEKNQALQAKFAELRKPVASETLASIDAKLEAARAGLGKTPRLEALEAHLADLVDERLGRKLARGAGALAGGKAGLAFGGPLGAAAGGMAGQEAGARLYDRLVRGITTGNAARAKTISTSVGRMFGGAAEKTAAALTKAAPLASKILPAIRYAEQSYVDGVLGAPNVSPSRSQLVNEFRARARELNALTQRTPEGGFTVRMQAREALNQRLAALWAMDPDFANGVEKTHNARLEFLASKLPRNPAPPHLQIGPDTWEPSRAQLAKFARYMEAVERPERVVQRLATATITPEDAEVLKAVYPQMYEQVRGQVMDNMASVRRRLPYEKRLALSIYLDVPVDPAVTPEAITVYQGLYAQGQAQQPGTSAGPPPRKAFTSSEKPTAGQRAAEG